MKSGRNRKITSDSKAATAIEYSLIAALIMVAIIGAVQFFSNNTVTMFSTISSSLTGSSL